MCHSWQHNAAVHRQESSGAHRPCPEHLPFSGQRRGRSHFRLGFLLSRDAVFCQRLTRLLGVTTRKSFKLGYAVHLQEVTEPGFGRRDIVIEGSGTRIVIEAKIGDAEPSAEQLLKYGAEDDLWTQYATRVVVALTQVELSAATREKVLLKLAENGIQFFNVQWHDVFGLILSYRPSNDSPTTSFLSMNSSDT